MLEFDIIKGLEWNISSNRSSSWYFLNRLLVDLNEKEQECFWRIPNLEEITRFDKRSKECGRHFKYWSVWLESGYTSIPNVAEYYSFYNGATHIECKNVLQGIRYIFVRDLSRLKILKKIFLRGYKKWI